MDILADQNCVNCVFWYSADATSIGICRAHPPSASGDAPGQWPATFPDDWCGEWA